MSVDVWKTAREKELKRDDLSMWVCVRNPGLCQNVITCMSKHALVYVSKDGTCFK